MIGRRGFFSALAAAATCGAVGALPEQPYRSGSTVEELQAIQREMDKLREKLEKPIHVTMVMDGKEIARTTMKAMVEEAKSHGYD